MSFVGRRYVYDPAYAATHDGHMREIDDTWTPTLPEAIHFYTEDSRVYSNAGVAPGTDIRIDTKRRHREYMKQNNLTTADDFTDTWAKAHAEKVRIKSFGTDDTAQVPKELHRPDRERREAIERAWYQYTEGKRK